MRGTLEGLDRFLWSQFLAWVFEAFVEIRCPKSFVDMYLLLNPTRSWQVTTIFLKSRGEQAIWVLATRMNKYHCKEGAVGTDSDPLKGVDRQFQCFDTKWSSSHLQIIPIPFEDSWWTMDFNIKMTSSSFLLTNVNKTILSLGHQFFLIGYG